MLSFRPLPDKGHPGIQEVHGAQETGIFIGCALSHGPRWAVRLRLCPQAMPEALCPGPYLPTSEAHSSLKVWGTGLDPLPMPQGPPSLSPFIFSLPEWPSRHSSESQEAQSQENRCKGEKSPGVTSV